MTNYRQTMSQALEYMYFVKETKLLERELTDTELKRREEIAKELDDQEFKDRYGKDWMQVKMGTATKMAKAEDLDEKADVSLKKKAEKSGISASILKQVYNRGVAAWRTGHRPGTTPEQWGHARVNSFISKSSGTWGGSDKDLAAKAKGQKEEVELDESVIDKVKQVASKKQAMKIDGVMVDTFTASAISQIYDKVNDANKKKMDKLPITKLASLAMKMMQKSEFVPEGKMQDVWQKKNAKSLSVGPFELLRGKSGVHTIKRSGEVIGDFSYDSDADNFVANMKGMKGQWTGNDIDSLFTHLQKVHKEEVELDEVFNGTKKDIRKIARATDNALRKRSAQIQKMLKSKTNEKGRGLTDFEFDHISDEGDAIAAELVYRKKGGKGPISDVIPPHLKKFVNEEVELDEDMLPLFYALWGTGAMAVLPALMIYDVVNRSSNYKLDAKVGETVGKLLSKFKKDKNYKPNSAEMDASKKLEKEVKSKEPSIFKKAMSKLNSIKSKKEEVEIEEASAAADARRAMRRDPEMKQRAFSKDDDATDDDKKAASKNIMVQMRKAQSLRGKFDVEFQDGKKVKIPAKMAIAVQQKYNSMRKPADKEKFQAKVAKSYKDMLTALKEQGEAPAAATPDYKAGGKSKADEYRQKAKQMVGTEGFASDAQRKAAFASGYKEKDKKKKESVLDRIDKKLKERKNG